MYGWIWRRLPFGLPGKLVGSALLLAGAMAVLWLWAFPAIDARLPFNDVQVGGDQVGPGQDGNDQGSDQGGGDQGGVVGATGGSGTASGSATPASAHATTTPSKPPKPTTSRTR
jgi:hypothetical protein